MGRKIVVYTKNDIIPHHAVFIYAREIEVPAASLTEPSTKIVEFYYEIEFLE